VNNDRIERHKMEDIETCTMDIPIILSACRIWESIKDSKIFSVISSDVFLEISRMQTVNEAESKCW